MTEQGRSFPNDERSSTADTAGRDDVKNSRSTAAVFGGDDRELGADIAPTSGRQDETPSRTDRRRGLRTLLARLRSVAIGAVVPDHSLAYRRWRPRPPLRSLLRPLRLLLVSFRSLIIFSTVLFAHRFTRRSALGAVATALAGTVGVGTAVGDREPETDSESDDSGRYVVGLEAGTSTASVSRSATTLYRSLDLAATGSIVVGEFNEASRRDLEARSDVRYVEPDHVRHQQLQSAVEPSEAVDLGDEQQTPWGIDRIGATDFHGTETGAADATVAILDSGIDPEHESLEVADGKAFTECNESFCATEWDDETGHGTHCAGTIAALDNGTGVVGAVPHVSLCALKVLAGDGSGYDSDIAAAIEWCAENDIDVINLSLGGSDEAQVLEDALEYAYDRGVLVVAAAGNDGSVGGIDYPAGYDTCIAVGATDDRDEVPDWSARGDGIELVAPGEDILSTKPDDEYIYLDGTSMSTPHVAAIGAQLMSQGLPHAERTDDVDDPGGVRGILRDTAEDVGFAEDEQGYGLLNAFDALEELEPVITDAVSDVRTRSATLNGSLRASAELSEPTVRFQWRDASDSDWTGTDSETTEPGEAFSATVDELEPDTAYDVRAVLEADDETATAAVETFETGLAELAVETGDVEATDHRTLLASGALSGLDGAERVDVAFRVRQTGDEGWESTDSQSIESIEPYEESISSLEPETEYEVEAVAESGDERATGETVTVETEPEPGHPEIERFEPTDDSNGQFVRCHVNWNVSDRDENLELVATELRYAGEDEVLHRLASEIEGGEESGIHTVRNSDRLEGAGEEYDVTLTVTDAEGNVTEETEQLSLDERSPAPSIDRFEVTSDDFLGTPEAVVEWAVSDEGDELDGVELELSRAEDGEVLDDSSSMARGADASGTDSLTDGESDGSEAAYDVTIRATDYFEQTTEETTRVTLGE